MVAHEGQAVFFGVFLNDSYFKNVTSMSNLNLKFNSKLTLSLFQILFHLKNNLSFISFHFFILNIIGKRFCFISYFKNLI